MKKKILFVSSEMTPFLESDTSVANLSRILPQAIQEKDNEIRILVPRFGVINERRNRLHEVVRLSGINITIDDNDNPLVIKVASIPNTKMQVYFLDNEDYFHRKSVYHDEKGNLHNDNDERTIFFCKGVLETVKKLGWAPDIIHCQGWMTSLVPMYAKTIYKDEPVFKNAKVIYTVHCEDFSGDLGNEFVRKASMNLIGDDQLSVFGKSDCSGLQAGGVRFADGVVTMDEKIPSSVSAELDSKPTIRHNEDALADTYSAFYDALMGVAQTA